MNRQVYVDGVEIRLTKTEYALLHVLARNADRAVTHGQLLLAVWGPARVNEVQYLRVFIWALRDKLEGDPAQPRRLLTVLGVGYRLVSAPSGRV